MAYILQTTYLNAFKKKMGTLIHISLKFVAEDPKYPKVSIDLGNGLVSTWQQTIM